MFELLMFLFYDLDRIDDNRLLSWIQSVSDLNDLLTYYNYTHTFIQICMNTLIMTDSGCFVTVTVISCKRP